MKTSIQSQRFSCPALPRGLAGLTLGAALLALALTAGCARNTASGSTYTYGQAQREQIVRTGTVLSVRPVTIQQDSGNMLGTIAGAVLGGVAGNAVGGGKGRTLLVIAGAGGVGSITIQLAKLAGFGVIATASRAESMAWCRTLGADAVINHRQPLTPQLQVLGVASGTLDAAVNFASTDQYWAELGELLAPQGHVGLIVEPTGALRIGDPYKAKCIGIHWEFMFARPRFRTADMHRQGEILAEVARLIDSGQLRGTRTETLTPINAANLRHAHARLESGAMIGKLVLEGWG